MDFENGMGWSCENTLCHNAGPGSEHWQKRERAGRVLRGNESILTVYEFSSVSRFLTSSLVQCYSFVGVMEFVNTFSAHMFSLVRRISYSKKGLKPLRHKNQTRLDNEIWIISPKLLETFLLSAYNLFVIFTISLKFTDSVSAFETILRFFCWYYISRVQTVLLFHWLCHLAQVCELSAGGGRWRVKAVRVLCPGAELG